MKFYGTKGYKFPFPKSKNQASVKKHLFVYSVTFKS